MTDRVPTQILENGAIRYAEYDSSGNFVQYRYLLPADEPTQAGTPLNKANLLTDATATELGLSSGAPTVNDALNVLSNTLYRHCQPLSIPDGNFQIVSNGVTPGYSIDHTILSGYPIWDSWEWAKTSSQMGILSWEVVPGVISGSTYAAKITWSHSLEIDGYIQNCLLKSKIQRGVSSLCGYPTLTFSFYAKGDVAGQKLKINFTQNYGTGGSPSSTDAQSQTISLTTSWARYSVTFTPTSLSSKTFGTNVNDYIEFSFEVNGTINTASSGYAEFTQVQVDIGSVALPYRNDGNRAYVISTGISGGWHYRKWSDRFCEMWQSWAYPNVPITTAYGPVYKSDISLASTNRNYPFTFKELPNAIPGITPTNFSSMILTDDSCTVSACPTYKLMCPVAEASAGVILNMYVSGTLA